MSDAPGPGGGAGPVLTPGALLAGFIKRTIIHCYTQNMKALGLVVSENKIFLWFSHCMSMGANDPGAGSFLTPGAWLAGFIKRTNTHSYIQNINALCVVVSEKKIFLRFFQWRSRGVVRIDPRCTVSRIIKRTTKYCYTQNMKALGPVVLEKKIVYVFSTTPPGRGAYGPQGHGWQDKTVNLFCSFKNLLSL